MDSVFIQKASIRFALALCFSLNSANIQAEQVIIYGIEIPGLHQENLQGSYDKIIQTILVEEKFAILKVYPPARAQLMFARCKANCCFSPANKRNDFYHFNEDISQTDAMNIAKIYIFVGENQQPIDSLSALQNKKVGARTGMPYGTIFEHANLTVHYVDSIEQNIHKLAQGRIDAFIAYVPDAYNVFKKLSIKPLPHNRKKPIAMHQDRLVCKAVSNQFINFFNKKLQQLSQTNQLQELLGENYISP